MKKFNDTGLCIPNTNYMIDISNKLKEIKKLVDDKEYFTINRPRQYGKTTTMFLIESFLNKDKYLVISTSFEGIDSETYNDKKRFIKSFLMKIKRDIVNNNKNNLVELINKNQEQLENLEDLNYFISDFAQATKKEIILLIDEVDKASNNQLFLDFLGMLRDKYLLRNAGKDYTFHSVILAGVYDIKNLKAKIRPDEIKKYNSPWNIAADFKVDMSFSPSEIKTMLDSYVEEKKVKMYKDEIADKLYFYTSGYPYLVSKLCKIIDEEIMKEKFDKDISKWEWKEEDVIEAVKRLISSPNVNFDTVIVKLENDKELYNFIQNIILGNNAYTYVLSVPVINKANTHGMIKKGDDGKVKISNKIYEEYITNHIVGKIETNSNINFDSTQSKYLKPNGRLDIEKILNKFQEVMKEKYSKKDFSYDDKVLEHNLRLLFLVFLKPIINGTGFSFKEVETGGEKRMDIVIIFKDEKFVIELKVWDGEAAHQSGKEQLLGYMEKENVDKGYMLIVNNNKKKDFKQATEDGIFMIWV